MSFSQQHHPQEMSLILSYLLLGAQGTLIESPEKEKSSTSTPTDLENSSPH
jgi:hypothetical protein